MNSTAERLSQIHAFDPSILERVGEVADRNADLSLGEFLATNQIPDVGHYKPDHGKKIEILDIIPNQDYEKVLVYHEAMATALDRNAVMHVAAIALAAPDIRVIAVGNPGRPTQGYGKVRLIDQHKVWVGDLRPIIDPTLQYLNSQGVENVTHAGFSYGADKVAAAATYSEQYDQCVVGGVFMDPVAIKHRGMLRLAKAYASTEKYLEQYIEASGSTAYLEARKESGGLLGYIIGLSRLTNIAIAHTLSGDGFESRLDAALTAQPEMRSHVMWGTESELSINSLMNDLTDRLQAKYGTNRLQTIRLIGQRHAMCDDIFLNAAAVLQAVES